MSIRLRSWQPTHHTWLALLFFSLVSAVSGCGGDGGGSNSFEPPTYTLSGAIAAPDGVAIDGDVNDPNESYRYRENDSITSAQSISNPVSLGGYVNVPGAGSPGRSFADGDPNDYFRVALKSGDRIFLSIGDYEAGDLDLYLYETTGGDPISFSIDPSNSESLPAPGDGDYVVNVYAASGASNYILTIGADPGAAAPDVLSSEHDFVAGQAVVRFSDSVRISDARALADQASDLGMTLAAGAAGRAVLLTFDLNQPSEKLTRTLGIMTRSSAKKAVAADLQVRIDTLQAIKALRKRSDVISAAPNFILRHQAAPDDPFYSLQWHYPLINLPRAWDITTGSADVIVAVVDTGVLLDHPDLAGKLTGGYDFISSTSRSKDGDGIDADPDDPGDSATSGASSFHGTHCAGTVAALTGNTSGLAGAGWNTRVMPIRVLGVGGGTLYDILQGVRYAARLENDSDTLPAQAADIISMSFGGGGFSAEAQTVFDQAHAAGCILIAAAGNESTSTPSYPASYDGVISVSAVTINATRASYSNFGDFIDVAAPGGDAGDMDGDGYADKVWSTCGDDSSGAIRFNYIAYNGTSMATPHVAGVAALMKAVRPGMTPAMFQAWLESFAITIDIGAGGKDDFYGYGLIDAHKAVLTALNSPDVTVLTVAPAALNLGLIGTSATLTVDRIGSDLSLSVSKFTSNPAAWLTVAAVTVDADGLGTYAVTVDRNMPLPYGTYTADIVFEPSTGNPISVPVNMQVSTSSTAADAGFHYVLLINANTSAVAAQDNVAVVGGKYDYSFTNVKPGDYFIIAGSDRDNDRFIDNPGESLGAYPALDQISTLTVGADLAHLDFATDLKLFLPTSVPASARPDDSQWHLLPALKRIR